MNQPFGSGLIQSLGDIGQRRGGSFTGRRVESDSELLHHRLQRRDLRAIDESAFLRLAIGLGGIGIVGHLELTGFEVKQSKVSPAIGPSRASGRGGILGSNFRVCQRIAAPFKHG